MSEKVRGAIFGVLGDIKGLTALDAFAGSGGVAIEAISRGAKSVIAVEFDKTAQKIIENNIEQLGIEDRMDAVRASVKGWSNRHRAEKFDLVFADPPYDDIPYKELKVLPHHLKETGTLVISWPGKAKTLSLDGLQVVENKNYGDAQLVFYKKIS